MKFFVTGAGGFIGSHVVAELVTRGHDVAILTRPTSNNSRLSAIGGLTRIVCSDPSGTMSDLEVESLKNFAPDTVIHLAWAGVGNSARNDVVQLGNVELTRKLVEIAHRVGAQHFVGFGSQAEYGPCEGAIDESQPIAPTTLYGAAKAATYLISKSLCEVLGVEFSWIRVFSTYGPGDEPYWMVQHVARDLLAGKTPQLTLGTQKWDYLYVEDAARAVASVGELSTGIGAVNLGSGSALTIREIVESIRDEVNPSAELEFGAVPFRPDQVMHLEANVGHLHTATGWAPQVSLAEGIKATVDVVRRGDS